MKALRRAVAVAGLVGFSVVVTDGSAGGSSQPSRWQAPVAGQVSVLRAFDPPVQRWLAGHRGVDLAAPVGSPVLAAGAGRVSFAATVAGRGVVVVVHGELRTTYEPVAASVPVGRAVAAGDVLGTLRAGHDPARPAAGVLHWGLRRGEVYLDPLALLARARPVRLLPHWDSGSLPVRARGTAAPPSRPPPVAEADASDPPQRSTRTAATTYAAALSVLALAVVAVARRPT